MAVDLPNVNTGDPHVAAHNAERARINAHDALLADTDWRALAVWDAAGAFSTGALVSTDWVPATGQAGFIHLRRSGTTVSVNLRYIKAAVANPSGQVIAIPSGFRPHQISRYTFDAFLNLAGAAKLVALEQQPGGGLLRGQGVTMAANDSIYGGVMVWQTRDAWPATLPGIAA